jgi:DNA-binding transcriptional regulator YbjK
MSAISDERERGVDMEVSRIVEMYLTAKVALPDAIVDLVALFGIAADNPLQADLVGYLGRMLQATKAGEVDASDAVGNLVNLAALSHSDDNELTAYLIASQA